MLAEEAIISFLRDAVLVLSENKDLSRGMGGGDFRVTEDGVGV